jgi:hypothetical protein
MNQVLELNPVTAKRLERFTKANGYGSYDEAIDNLLVEAHKRVYNVRR